MLCFRLLPLAPRPFLSVVVKVILSHRHHAATLLPTIRCLPPAWCSFPLRASSHRNDWVLSLVFLVRTSVTNAQPQQTITCRRDSLARISSLERPHQNCPRGVSDTRVWARAALRLHFSSATLNGVRLHTKSASAVRAD